MVVPPVTLHADLDWSCYAGKKHQHPWFILSMLLLAEAGYRLFVHGSTGHTQGRLYTEHAMRQLNLPVAMHWTQVSEQLERENLSYLPLENYCQPLQELMQLRHLLGLRSPVNTLSRMLNPLHATASLQSIFHPAYARLHQEADLLLEQPRALVFKGESGEVEVKPHADTRLSLLSDKQLQEIALPRYLTQRVESVVSPSVEPVRSLWRGSTSNHYGLSATLATTAAALLVLVPEISLESAQQQASKMWNSRDSTRLT